MVGFQCYLSTTRNRLVYKHDDIVRFYVNTKLHYICHNRTDMSTYIQKLRFHKFIEWDDLIIVRRTNACIRMLYSTIMYFVSILRWRFCIIYVIETSYWSLLCEKQIPNQNRAMPWKCSETILYWLIKLIFRFAYHNSFGKRIAKGHRDLFKAFDLPDVKNRRFQSVVVYRVFICPKKYLRRLKAYLLKSQLVG